MYIKKYFSSRIKYHITISLLMRCLASINLLALCFLFGWFSSLFEYYILLYTYIQNQKDICVCVCADTSARTRKIHMHTYTWIRYNRILKDRTTHIHKHTLMQWNLVLKIFSFFFLHVDRHRMMMSVGGIEILWNITSVHIKKIYIEIIKYIICLFKRNFSSKFINLIKIENWFKSMMRGFLAEEDKTLSKSREVGK